MKHRYRCPCADCREARATKQWVDNHRRSMRLEGDPDAAPHGRPSTYCNWKCRCVPCSEAWSDYLRAYRQRRKQAA